MSHRRWSCTVLFLVGALLAGCSAPKLSSEVRPGFDLSGAWRIDPARSDAAPEAGRIVDEMDRRIVQGSRRGNIGQEIRDGAVFAFISQDFPMLIAERLDIEQHADSMGIRYTPGGYRDISWGTKERGLWTIDAGWDKQGEFVIHSDSEDIRAQERHVMLDPSTLQVRLRVRADGGDLDLVRTFVRQ